MTKVTPEQALETYKRTIADAPKYEWAKWIQDVNNAVMLKDVSILQSHNAYVLAVYHLLMKEQSHVYYSDED